MPALPLADWRDFYVMIGTASGAIVGATFVVASLAEGLRERAVLGLRGFISPSVVHLSSVLVGSAILSVPTLTPFALMALLGAGGIAGVVYSVIAFTRIKHLKLDMADRSFYIAVPILSYAAIAAAAMMARTNAEWTLDILAAALVALLIVGMRNAWDMATFMLTRDRSEGTPPA